MERAHRTVQVRTNSPRKYVASIRRRQWVRWVRGRPSEKCLSAAEHDQQCHLPTSRRRDDKRQHAGRRPHRIQHTAPTPANPHSHITLPVAVATQADMVMVATRLHHCKLPPWESLWVYQLLGMSPLKVTLPVGRCRPPSNTWFLGPSRVHNRMVSWLVELFLQGPWSWLTDKQTDYRPHYSACSNKSHILMLCGLTMTTTTRRPSHCQVNCDMPEAQDLIIYGYHNQPLKL